jgi:hypothetical protein
MSEASNPSIREDRMIKHLQVLAAALIAMFAAGVSSALADPGRGAEILCYLWANDPTNPAIYTPSTTYSFNAEASSNGITVQRTGRGHYTVTCKGVGGASLASGGTSWGSGGHVQVTAYGTRARICKVQDWSTGGTDFVAHVNCYANNNSPNNGSYQDNEFDLLFIW